MTIVNILYVVVFWIMQIIATLFFKWGSLSPDRWLWGFLVGNIFGFSSIWLLMLLYRSIHPNVALGIGAGGAFLLSQLCLAFVFRSGLGVVQWAGVLSILLGMWLLAVGK